MLVEFENVFLIGGIFYNWGQLGANVIGEFENVFLIGGILFSQLGPNVLVELEIFFNLGAFFYNWGQCWFGGKFVPFWGHTCV